MDAQDADPTSILNLSRELIGLRRRYPALKTGGMRMLEAAGSLLAFERGEGDEALLCVFNLGHSPEAWTAPEGWRLVEAVNLPDPTATSLPPLAGLLLARSA